MDIECSNTIDFKLFLRCITQFMQVYMYLKYHEVVNCLNSSGVRELI